MVRFSLRLLGSFEARQASGSTALAPGKKIQALLATLGVRPGQSQSRDRLASLLWGDVSQEQARHSVRQAIFCVRRMFAEEVLITLGETVALNPEAVTVDVAQFDQFAASTTAEALEQAAPLYRGDLLEGF